MTAGWQHFFHRSKIGTNILGEKKSTFCPFEHPYDSPLPTLRKFLKFLKLRFFAFFSKKNQHFYFFLHVLVKKWLV